MFTLSSAGVGAKLWAAQTSASHTYHVTNPFSAICLIVGLRGWSVYVLFQWGDLWFIIIKYELKWAKKNLWMHWSNMFTWLFDFEIVYTVIETDHCQH